MEIYLVYVDAIQNSNKFWSGKIEGNNLIVQWGRVGYQAQTKVHECGNYQRAVAKFHNLVTDKKAKGYIESQSQMNSDRSTSDVRRAIQLLNIIRPFVANRDFDDNYIIALNEYLKIVTTPLGMQIDPSRVYRTVEDVDYQKELLNSLSLLTTPTLQSTAVAVATPGTIVEHSLISLKSISKNFWRHL